MRAALKRSLLDTVHSLIQALLKQLSERYFFLNFIYRYYASQLLIGDSDNNLCRVMVLEQVV